MLSLVFVCLSIPSFFHPGPEPQLLLALLFTWGPVASTPAPHSLGTGRSSSCLMISMKLHPSLMVRIGHPCRAAQGLPLRNPHSWVVSTSCKEDSVYRWKLSTWGMKLEE